MDQPSPKGCGLARRMLDPGYPYGPASKPGPPVPSTTPQAIHTRLAVGSRFCIQRVQAGCMTSRFAETPAASGKPTNSPSTLKW